MCSSYYHFIGSAAARLLLNTREVDYNFGMKDLLFLPIQLPLIQFSPVVQTVKMFWDPHSIIQYSVCASLLDVICPLFWLRHQDFYPVKQSADQRTEGQLLGFATESLSPGCHSSKRWHIVISTSMKITNFACSHISYHVHKDMLRGLVEIHLYNSLLGNEVYLT